MWMRIAPVFLACLVAALAISFAGRGSAAEDATVRITVFHQHHCPYCRSALDFIGERFGSVEGVSVEALEISQDEEALDTFLLSIGHFGIDRAVVPLVIIGDRAFLGYAGPERTGRAYAAAVEACRAEGCADVVALLRGLSGGAGAVAVPAAPPPAAAMEPIRVPFLGEISPGSLSLPVLTVVLAAIDGFNPCAMWVLVFLIGLLLGIRDHVRMWSLGIVFLVTSAAVYFAFMAAWLNALLLIGAAVWLRLGIGALAMGAGGYYVAEFVRNPSGACRIGDAEGKSRMRDRLRAAVTEQRFVLSLLGVVVLAVGVNMVELVCSAGIPAIYTQVLALSDLPLWQYYAYITLYIVVFLIDDILVFVTAMLALQAANVTAVYTRYAHLVGGIVLLVIGLGLVFAPEWLTFAV